MKAIGYIRVSTEKQSNEGVSLDDQESKIKEYAKLKDLDLVDIIADKGVSGGIALNQREGGKKLLSKVDNDSIEIVISMKLDRLFRDAIDCLTITKEWDNSGIALHLLDLGGNTLDTSSPMGRMFLTMSAGFAEMEKNLIGQRTKNALKYKKNNKQAYSPTPTGYKRTGDDLKEDKREMKTIKLIKKLRKAGNSLRNIAAELNSRGIPTKNGGKKWYASTVNYILKNNLYEEVV